MSDYDGTLVPLAPTPEEARPSPELLRLLTRLCADPRMRVAVISGRKVEDLASLLPVPGLFLAGLHGREVLHPPAGCGPLPPITLGPPGPPAEVWKEILACAKELTSRLPGSVVEDKKSGVAFHFRQADPVLAEQILESFVRRTRPLVEAYQLEYLKGNKVLEVRVAGIHKGLAVEHFLKLFPRAFPVYIGDDLTDEDGFRAVGSRGLTVLVGKRYPTLAAYSLSSPKEVENFLSQLAGKDTG